MGHARNLYPPGPDSEAIRLCTRLKESPLPLRNPTWLRFSLPPRKAFEDL